MKGPLEDVDIPELTVHDLLYRFFPIHYGKIALIDGLTDVRHTYDELHNGVQSIASSLVKLGVRKGDIAAIICPNCPEFIYLHLAFLTSGAAVTAINPLYTPFEMSHMLKDSAAKWVFAAESSFNTVVEAIKIAGSNVKNIVTLSPHDDTRCVTMTTLLQNDDLSALDNIKFNVREDLAIIPYSSGTTGLPKGVMLTHYNIVSMFMILAHPGMRHPVLDDGAQYIVMAVMPFFHAYGMVSILTAGLASGACLITLPRFQPETFLRCIEQYKISAIPIVPPIVVALMKNKELLSKFDLSSIRLASSGAAALSGDMEQEFQKELSVSVFKQGYGLTETTVGCMYNMPSDLHKPGSVGLPLANTEIQVINTASGKPCGTNEPGEIWVKGPQVMKGYLNNPKATNDMLDTNGWLHTGDVGYYDNDGFFYIVDRIKDLIKYKGFQVAPAELESLILSHPNVTDVAVVGVKDTESGELPKAFVVIKEGSVVTTEEIKSLVSKNLSKFKHLRGGVQFVKEIPRLPTGKVIRRQLRDPKPISKL